MRKSEMEKRRKSPSLPFRQIEERGQKTEVRDQRTEVRGQRSEVRGQKTDIPDSNRPSQRAVPYAPCLKFGSKPYFRLPHSDFRIPITLPYAYD